MPLNLPLIPVTTPEQKRTVGRAGEGVTIDKNTFELKGVNTGTVFGKGANLQEALALQVALQSGSSPTVGGRPDLLAVEQRPGVAVDPIAGANGQPVQPRVATPGELAQAGAGTLPSFNKVTGGTPPAGATPPTITPPPTAPQPPTTFDQAMTDALTAGANAKKDQLLGAPDSYDNQILRQKAALMSKMFGQDLTPDDLKWLTPAQSQAVLSGDERLIKAEIAGLNTITQGRKEQKAAEEERATKQYEMFAKSGTPPDQLPQGFLQGLDEKLGLPTGTFESTYRSDYAANEQEKQSAALDAQIKISDYLKTQPYGTKVKIGDATYLGTDTGQVEINEKTGDIYALQPDRNGQLAVRYLGNMGPQQNRDIIQQFNANTGQYEYWSVDPNNPSDAKPVTYGGNGGASTGGVNTYALIDDFPADQGFSDTSWCLEWQRKIAVDGSFPPSGTLDTIDQKAAWADQSIGFGEGQRPPGVGDYVLTNEDSEWGHIALITEVRIGPDGRRVGVLAESNYKHGKVTYNRTIPIDEANMALSGGAVMGFHKAQLNPKYSSQSGGEPQPLIAKPEESTPVISVPQQADLRNQIAKDKAIVQYQDLSSTYNSMDSIAKSALSKPTTESRASLDQALVTLFNKMLDPTSVVREGEYARTAEGQSVLTRAQGYALQLQQGGAGITDATRKDMVDVSKILQDVAQQQYQTSVDYWIPILSEYGLDPTLFIRDYDSGASESPSVEGSVTAETLKTKYPTYSSKIDSLLQQGYSIDEINQALANK